MINQKLSNTRITGARQDSQSYCLNLLHLGNSFISWPLKLTTTVTSEQFVVNFGLWLQSRGPSIDAASYLTNQNSIRSTSFHSINLTCFTLIHNREWIMSFIPWFHNIDAKLLWIAFISTMKQCVRFWPHASIPCHLDCHVEAIQNNGYRAIKEIICIFKIKYK